MRPAHSSGIRLTAHRLLSTRHSDAIERDRRSDASLKKTLLQLSSASKVARMGDGVDVYFFEERQP